MHSTCMSKKSRPAFKKKKKMTLGIDLKAEFLHEWRLEKVKKSAESLRISFKHRRYVRHTCALDGDGERV